jgi:hypothetical protein
MSLDPAQQRALVYGLLGELPDRRRPITAEQRDERGQDGYALESWVLDLNGLERPWRRTSR